MVAGLGITKPISPGSKKSGRLEMIEAGQWIEGRVTEQSSVEQVTRQKSDHHDEKPHNTIEVYPDGGRGWLVCFAVFLMNFAAWGCNLSLSIYILYYVTSYEGFKEFPRSVISLISGASLSVMLLIAPFSNYMENLVGIRSCVAIGAIINSLALYLTSLSTSLVHVILTQAVLAGIGRGLMSTPSAYVLSRWFNKRCTLATGISHIGSGVGGVVFSYLTNYFLTNHGLNASYHANNVLSTALAIPCVIFISTRCPTIDVETGKPVKIVQKNSVLSINAISNMLVIILFIRAFFTQWVYTFIRAIMPSYYKEALGGKDDGAAILQLTLSAGMAIGRPIMGFVSDKIGVPLVAVLCESIALLSYYVLWYPTEYFSALAVHSFIQGSLGGIFFLTALPLTMSITPPKDVRSVVTVIWIISATSSMFSLYVSLLIVDYAESKGFTTKASYQQVIYFNSAMMSVAIALSVVLYFKIKRGRKLQHFEENKEVRLIDGDELSLIGQ